MGKDACQIHTLVSDHRDHRHAGLGLFEIGPLPQKIPILADIGGIIHEYTGKSLIAVISLHIAGALKHHLIDKDGTLRRMLGARVG